MSQVLIEFIADYSQIESAQDVLLRTGALDKDLAAGFKNTNTQINKQADAIKKTAAAVSNGPIKSIDQLDAKTRKFVSEFIKGFEEGVQQELKAAKTEIDALRKKFEDSGKSISKGQDNVRTKLKATVTELQNLQAAGLQNTERFKELEKLAGQYGDALDEVNAKVRNSRDGERSINRLVEASTALVGGYTAVAGATALMGGENAEFEKTLVKVNGAMAVLQGLQAVTKALQSDGAITQALLNAQEKIALAQKYLDTAATSKNVVVKYAAVAAQRALNLVMAANPFYLVAAALATVVIAMANYTRNTRAAVAETERLKNAIETTRFDAEVKALQRAGALRAAQLKANGATESQIVEDQLQTERQLQAARIRELNAVNTALAKATDQSTEDYKNAVTRRNTLLAEIEDANTAGQIANIGLVAQRREEAEAATEEAKAKRAEAQAKRDEAERRRLADIIAQKKLEQLDIDSTRQEYSRLEAVIIRLQAAYDSIGQSAAQAGFLQAKAAKDAADELDRTAPKAAEISGKLVDLTKIQAGATTKALEGIGQVGDATIKTVTLATQTASEQIAGFLNRNSQLIGETIGALQTISQGAQALAAEDQTNSNIRIDNKRRETDALLEAGAITEKEAIARQKKIDLEEKRAQLQAAKRQKELAIFGATVNTIQGVTQALASLPPPFNFIQAGIIAAFGFAQVLKIKQRPLPKFAVGKKGSFEGLGVMGEAGTEMKVDSAGAIQFASKPTTVYVGKQDKIYTAAETKAYLAKPDGHRIEGTRQLVAKEKPAPGFDYVRLESMLAKRGPAAVVNIEKDFISHAVADGLYRRNYMQRRYRFKA